ncbi:MAG: hypothetical protein II433_09155 [Acidaminococcaceae bacterium]|jgi:hypothetical protein|nr:hypothetical protein [Acidaminococcaceae bacterium]MBQ2220372.1 hypothetical protein [Acidaminococcaceae bacterium]MBQ2221761.1 hypothetical protein [Acidaminococcaceae bacterium]
MREIDDRYPEYARPYEPLRGGRHHGRLTGNEGAAFQRRLKRRNMIRQYYNTGASQTVKKLCKRPRFW